jgi:hypothetical protein
LALVFWLVVLVDSTPDWGWAVEPTTVGGGSGVLIEGDDAWRRW